MKVRPQYFTYENLPCIHCKDKLMAASGMYMGPGPKIPGLGKRLVENLPNMPPLSDGNHPIPGRLPMPGEPGQGGDTSKVQPGQFINPYDYQKPPPLPSYDRGPNFGNAALLGLSAFDALLPNKYNRQTVVQPQMAYNPNPYGYGSQAIMQYGGYIPRADYGYVMGEDENNSPSARNGIYIKPSKRGSLHDALGIPRGEKIPASKLKDKPGDSPAMKKKKNFARNARKWSHEDGGMVPEALHLFEETTLPEAKSGNWIQKAVNPAHKGYCTPMTKSTCTPRRKALAKTFKKHHGFHKSEDGGKYGMGNWTETDRNDPMSMITADMDIGGFIAPGWDKYKIGGIITDNMSVFNPHQYEAGGNVNGGAKLREVGANYPNTDLFEQWLLYANGGNVNGGAKLREVGAMYPNTDLMEQWLLYENGGQLSAAKAKEMLKDGTANGKKLTKKQKQYFGMVAAGKAAMGTEIGGTGPGTGDPRPPGSEINWNSRNIRGSQIERDALLSDRIAEIIGNSYDPYKGQGRAILGGLNLQYPDLVQDLGVRLKQVQSDPTYSQMTPEQRLTRFYNTGRTGTTNLDQFINRARTLGGNQAAFWQRNATNVNRTGMRNGGIMYDDGGTVNTMWGGTADLESYNPYDGGTIEFNGPSHENGGIGMAYNGSPIEVEGGEYASRDSQGNLNIYGNMYIPGTRTKFKAAAGAIMDKEKRYNYLKTKGADLVNNSNPANRFDQLKFNAGQVMMNGGEMGMADLASKKERLSNLQKDMLDMASFHGIDPFEMSKGKMKKAKGGASLPFMENGGSDPGDNDPTRADRNMNPGNIRYGDFAKKYGAKKDKDGFAIFPDRKTGEKAMQDLLTSKNYSNLSAKDAIRKWTGGNPYRYDLGPLTDKKISEMNPDELSIVLSTMQQGEGTRYGLSPRPVPGTPKNTPAPNVPSPGSYTPYGLPDVTLDTPVPQVTPRNPVPPYDQLNIPENKSLPSNVEPLHLNQLAGEIYAAATNRVEPVPAQRYEPQLFTPYQISFQDRLNANQAVFNAQARAVGAGNPAALGTLGAQKYQADSAALADEFRANQAIANDITNKNIALVNDANLKNLGLADTQMTRQSQARSKTRELNQMILNSISSKYAQNELENKKLAAYENLYDYRFIPTDDGGLRATYMGPNAMFNYEGRNTSGQKPQDVRTISRYDAKGNLKGYADYEDSDLREQQRLLDLEAKRRKLPLMPMQPLNK